MPEVAVRDLTGAQVDSITLSDDVFAVSINSQLMHQAVRRILADQRSGTHKAKTRSEVVGGGAKPWRQKGTGRARQGTRSSPLWAGGGVAFPPRPRSYRLEMPKKMRRQAARSALSSRLADNAVIVVASLEPDEPRTKRMAAALSSLNASGKILMVDEQVSETTSRAARNLPSVQLKPASTLNIVDVLEHDMLVFTVNAIRHVERVLAHANV